MLIKNPEIKYKYIIKSLKVSKNSFKSNWINYFLRYKTRDIFKQLILKLINQHQIKCETSYLFHSKLVAMTCSVI